MHHLKLIQKGFFFLFLPDVLAVPDTKSTVLRAGVDLLANDRHAVHGALVAVEDPSQGAGLCVVGTDAAIAASSKHYKISTYQRKFLSRVKTHTKTHTVKEDGPVYTWQLNLKRKCPRFFRYHERSIRKNETKIFKDCLMFILHKLS